MIKILNSPNKLVNEPIYYRTKCFNCGLEFMFDLDEVEEVLHKELTIGIQCPNCKRMIVKDFLSKWIECDKEGNTK